MKKVILVAGARPNFMKFAPILRVIEICEDVNAVLVHTGHVMIDNLFYQLRKIDDTCAVTSPVRSLKECLPEKYLCMTLHWPSNFDDRAIQTSIMKTVSRIA